LIGARRGGRIHGVSRAVAWRDVLSITAITSGDGLNSILMPLLLDDAGYSAAAIGPLVAILSVASLASRFPVGVVYRPSRARWLLIVSLLSAAACSVFYPAAAGSPGLLAVLRVLHGIASGVATTVNLAFFIDSLPPGSSRPYAMGLYGGGMAAGYTIGNLSGGVVADWLGYGGAFVCGALFWAGGLAQVLTRAAVQREGEAGQAGAAAAKREGHSFRAMLRALRDPAVVDVSMLAFQLNAILMIGGTFFPLVAREAGLALSEIGFVRAIHSGVNAVARPFSSPLIVRVGAGRVSFASFALQAGAIALIPAVAFGGLAAYTILFAIVGAGRAIGFTANAIALAEDIPESRLSRGLSSSLYSAARDLGNIAGPIIGSGMISLFGLSTMFLTAPLLLLVLQLGVTTAVRRTAPAD
jgi:MFS transporter, DHA1 family, multidrug resistance protein